MENVTALFKALGDENRMRALAALTHGELCACQITELLALAPSTVSKHLDVLRQAGLVISRKEGRWMFFRLNDNGGPAREAFDLAMKALAKDKKIAADRKRLNEILKIDPEILCQKQACARRGGCE